MPFPKGKKKTPAQLAAARRNLAKARAANKNRKKTPAQIAAARKNLAKARAARKGKHLPLTPKQRAAMLANLIKARAALAAKRGHHMDPFKHRDLLKAQRRLEKKFRHIRKFNSGFRPRTFSRRFT